MNVDLYGLAQYAQMLKLTIMMEGYKAENDNRKHRNESMAYGETEFFMIAREVEVIYGEIMDRIKSRESTCQNG